MAMKRANGSGTVYKMKHKQLRKPYRADVSVQSSSTTLVTVWPSTDSSLNSMDGLGHKANRAMPQITIILINTIKIRLIVMIRGLLIC